MISPTRIHFEVEFRLEFPDLGMKGFELELKAVYFGASCKADPRQNPL